MGPMLLDITKEEPVLHVAGEVDASNAGQLAAALEPEARHGGVIAVDISNLSFIDASGAHVLLDAANKIRGRGRLLLCSPSAPVRRVLDVVDAGGQDALDVVADSALDVMRRLFVSLARFEAHAVEELLASDAIWHVPGHNRFSGVYEGREQIFGMAARMKEFTAEYIHEVEDVVWGESHVAVLAQLWGDREGKILFGAREITAFRVQGGLVAEGWTYLFDPDEVDRFWS
jgi:uncharacterized protein